MTSPYATFPDSLANPQRPSTPTAFKTGSGIVLILAAVVIIVLIGRPFDYILVGLKLPGITCIAALIAALVLGGLPQLWSRFGIAHFGLILWMFVATLGSVWKGGSLEYVLDYAMITSAWVAIATGPRRVSDVRKLMFVATVIYVRLLVVANMGGVTGDGRLSVSHSTHGNSEDLAMFAGAALPLCLYFASRIKLAPVRWILIVASVLFAVHTVGMTGSRAGLVALLVTGAVYMYRTTGVKRLLVVFAAGLALLFIMVSVPDRLLNRLGTIFSPFEQSQSNRPELNEAVGSSLQRRELLKDSIWITITHPIIGVGPGQFAQFRWDQGQRTGYAKAALVTHNTYTQISSESGIPGLLLYLAMLYGIFRTLRNVQKLNMSGDPESRDCLYMIFCLELSFVSFAVCAFFVSVVQYLPQFLLAGFALALERISKVKAASAPPPPAPVVPRSGLVAGGPRIDDRRAGRNSLSLPAERYRR